MRALNTAGRAVLFAGGTVCIALLGLLVLRLSFLNGMAFASVITVVLTMAAALTLLPALLGFMGMRVLSRRERRGSPRAGPTTATPRASGRAGRASSRGGRVVLARRGARRDARAGEPRCSTCASASPTPATTPPRRTTRKAYDLLAAGFGPGSNGPLLLVAETGTPADTAALGRADADPAAGARRRRGRALPVQPGRQGRDRRRSMPDDLSAGRGDQRPHRPPARPT